jgi:hypothetical protein
VDDAGGEIPHRAKNSSSVVNTIRVGFATETAYGRGTARAAIYGMRATLLAVVVLVSGVSSVYGQVNVRTHEQLTATASDTRVARPAPPFGSEFRERAASTTMPSTSRSALQLGQLRVMRTETRSVHARFALGGGQPLVETPSGVPHASTLMSVTMNLTMVPRDHQ